MLRKLRSAELGRRFSSAPKVGVLVPLNVVVPQELVYLTHLSRSQQHLMTSIGLQELLTAYIPQQWRGVEELGAVAGKDVLKIAPPNFAEVYEEALSQVGGFRKIKTTEKPADDLSGGAEAAPEEAKSNRRPPSKPAKSHGVSEKPVTFDPYLHNLINSFSSSWPPRPQNGELDALLAIQRGVATSLSRVDFYEFSDGKFSGRVCRMEGFASVKLTRLLEPQTFSMSSWVRGLLMDRINACDSNLATVRKVAGPSQLDSGNIQSIVDSLRLKLDENSPHYILKSEEALWGSLRESGCALVEYESIPDTYRLVSRLNEADYRHFVEILTRISHHLKALSAKTVFSVKLSKEVSPGIERASASIHFNSLVALLFVKHVFTPFDLYFLANEPDMLLRAEFVAQTVKRFTTAYLSSWTLFDSKSQNSVIENQKLNDAKNVEDLYEQMKKYQEDSSPASKRALIDKVSKMLKSAKLSESVRKGVTEELNRFAELSEHDSDYNNVKNYLELVLKMPFGRFSVDQTSLQRASQILDDSHFGMEEIKKRILQFLAVGRTKGSLINKKIICLLGPPGVGKTSISKAIADCLGRKFVRVSLGGENDVSVIKGHRRTYIGAYPGKIVNALKMAGTENPVILLDEVDKVSQRGFKGNIQDVLLEILDPAQNHSFHDHYLDLSVDLSKVLFLCSANVLDSTTITPALYDRMEVIELSGYTMAEKLAIFDRHLLPKTLKKIGLDKYQVKIDFPTEVVKRLITDYAREPGVRNLEKHLVKIFEKTAFDFFQKNQAALLHPDAPQAAAALPETVYKVDEKTLRDYLGPKRFYSQTIFHQKEDLIGFAFGLGYNGFGGSVLSIEVLEVPRDPSVAADSAPFDAIGNIDNISISKPQAPQPPHEKGPEPATVKSDRGDGSLVVTGSLGGVMKESVEIAYSFAKFYLYKINRDPSYLESRHLHIHFPEGASKKDGPSAGITIVTALISAATGLPYDPRFAMTGEISLNGKVLKIGGLKEKVLAARREGITHLIVPHANEREVREMKADVTEGVTFHFVENYDEVDRLVFGGKEGKPNK